MQEARAMKSERWHLPQGTAQLGGWWCSSTGVASRLVRHWGSARLATVGAVEPRRGFNCTWRPQVANRNTGGGQIRLDGRY